MKIHEHGYWLEEPPARYHDVGLRDALCAKLRGQAVLDLGCGDGWYVDRMRCAGIMAYGADGNPTERTGPFLFTWDLAVPLLFPVAWTLSIEVGEHIPAEYADVFLDSLASNARLGSILSWAIPGQGGAGHVNEQPNEWVRAQMAVRGLLIDRGATKILRDSVSGEAPWLRQTLMVFTRTPVSEGLRETGLDAWDRIDDPAAFIREMRG